MDRISFTRIAHARGGGVIPADVCMCPRRHHVYFTTINNNIIIARILNNYYVSVRAFVCTCARAFALVREPAVLCLCGTAPDFRRLLDGLVRLLCLLFIGTWDKCTSTHGHPTHSGRLGQRPPPPPFSSCVFRAPWPWALVSMRQWTPAVKQAPPLPLLAAPLPSWRGTQAWRPLLLPLPQPQPFHGGLPC